MIATPKRHQHNAAGPEGFRKIWRNQIGIQLVKMDGGVVYRHFCNAGQTRTSCFGVWGSGLFGIGLGNALLDDGINLFGAGVDNIVDHMLVIISRTGNLSFGTAQALLNDFLHGNAGGVPALSYPAA